MVVSSSKFNFKDAMEGFLKNYADEAITAATQAINDVSKEAVKKLKVESQAEFGSGPYAKGWARKLERGRLYSVATVYGKSGTYQLAHLLEHGHVVSNGTKRVFGKTSARVHIEPVEQWAISEAVERTVSYIERITR